MCQKRKPKTIPKKEKGLTIIGLLIAIAIISLSLTTGLGLITRNLRLASITAHEITAAALAQEGIELVRNIRDTGDNYCLKNSVSPLNGFDRIDNPNQSYAMDNYIDTYTNGQGGNKILTGNSHFKQNNAGLYLDGDDNYATCAINNANRQFIRKIQILNTNYGDGQAPDPDITYSCETVNGAGGILAVVTVYWSEFWEDNWPANFNADSLQKENDKTLHRVRVSKCFYDWRPE